MRGQVFLSSLYCDRIQLSVGEATVAMVSVEDLNSLAG